MPLPIQPNSISTGQNNWHHKGGRRWLPEAQYSSVNPGFQCAELADEHQRDAMAGYFDDVSGAHLSVNAGTEQRLVILNAGLIRKRGGNQEKQKRARERDWPAAGHKL